MGSTAGLVEPLKGRVDQLLRLAGGRITVVSGRRTYAEQAALRRRNGCPDVYTSPASACRVPTARPGTSRHESGLAVDLGGDLSLAAKLGAQLGLKQAVSGEPWHFEPAEAAGGGGDGGTTGWGWNAVERVAAVGSDEHGLGGTAVVDQFVAGVRRLLITSLILGGAASFVVMGFYRTVTGRSLVRTGAITAVETGKGAVAGAIAGPQGAAMGAAAGSAKGRIKAKSTGEAIEAKQKAAKAAP